ncbi:hypothetical protein DFP72DRAFT_1065125 [Ephemerocybe angulata]|uniref:Zn(2)-C6 fungal-type domain-containing protein n=1 Tax=Ephemerocybe angulata TaxID=980116 RepID=A0A8H6M7M9_9AGAR|nr:hypothetical protein DFP72DRAFT_1065125 [Tulosesus angulatus]
MANYDRSTNLPRGAACKECHRRRIRCNGIRPLCQACEESGRNADCEYPDDSGHFPSDYIERLIRELEHRKEELEGRLETNTRAMRAFLGPVVYHASSLGLFIHYPKLLDSLSSPNPNTRPTPSLLETMYLWGVRLSTDHNIRQSHEPSFRARALETLDSSLSPTRPIDVVHGVQADILFAHYDLSEGLLQEVMARLQLNTTPMVLSHYLHKIRSRDMSTPPTTIPAPGTDPAVEGELILAFWHVYIMDKLVAGLLQERASIRTVPDRSDARVDLPWGMDMEEYEAGLLTPNIRTSHTVHTFLEQGHIANSPMGTAPIALLAKTVIVWERASQLGHRIRTQMRVGALTDDQKHAFEVQIQKVDSLVNSLRQVTDAEPIQTVMASLVPETLNRARMRVMWESFLYDAVIKLHQRLGRWEKAVDAAERVIWVVKCASGGQSGNDGSVESLNPFVSFVWPSAAGVLAEQIKRHRLSPGALNAQEKEKSVKNAYRRLQSGLEAMKRFIGQCPMIDRKIREAHDLVESIRLR